MAITENSRSMAAPLSGRITGSRKPGRQSLRHVLRAAWEALATGQAAAADFRRLEAMTPGQLKAQGLSRPELPQELFRRHFAGLPGRSAE